MNKSILPLLVTIMILALVGCSHHSDVAPSTNDGQEKGTTSALQTIGEAAETYSGFESASQPIVAGTYYTRNALVDQQLGVDVFSAFLPAGWTGSVASDWTITSADSPGLETITLVAPDNRAQITISSRQDFVQHPLGDEGSSFENYTNYLNYMDADGFTDAYIRLAYGTEATLLTELPDDEATLDQLRQYANTLVDRANATEKSN